MTMKAAATLPLAMLLDASGALVGLVNGCLVVAATCRPLHRHPRHDDGHPGRDQT